MTEHFEAPSDLDVLCRYHFDLSTCLGYCDALASHVEANGDNRLDPTYLALVDAAILTYARPFTKGKVLAGTSNRMRFEHYRFDREEWNEAHDWWIDLRHKAVAHSDEFFTMVRAIPQAPAGSYHSHRATLTPEMVRLMRNMVRSLLNGLEAAIAAEHEATVGPVPAGPRWRTAGHAYMDEPEWYSFSEEVDASVEEGRA